MTRRAGAARPARPDPDPGPSATCPACGHAFTVRYCPRCGARLR